MTEFRIPQDESHPKRRPLSQDMNPSPPVFKSFGQAGQEPENLYNLLHLDQALQAFVAHFQKLNLRSLDSA
jgi:hypothetical protein